MENQINSMCKSAHYHLRNIGAICKFITKGLPEDARNIILTPVIQIILKQEASVGELIKLIETLPSDDLTNRIKTDLQSLKDDYTALNMDDQIKNNRADLMLSDKTLEGITKTVNKMRMEIIE